MRAFNHIARVNNFCTQRQSRRLQSDDLFSLGHAIWIFLGDFSFEFLISFDKIAEENVPVIPTVQGACEILGFDPLYVANEGKLVAICSADSAEALQVLRLSLRQLRPFPSPLRHVAWPRFPPF